MFIKHPYSRFGAILAFSLISTVLFLGLYFFRTKLIAFPLANFSPASFRPSLAGDIYNFQFSENTLSLAGWLIDQDGQYSGYNWGNDSIVYGPYNCSWFALLDEERQLIYRLPTQASVPPDDMELAIPENMNFGRFFLVSKTPKQQLPHGKFTICILTQLPDDQNYILLTNHEVSL